MQISYPRALQKIQIFFSISILSSKTTNCCPRVSLLLTKSLGVENALWPYRPLFCSRFHLLRRPKKLAFVRGGWGCALSRLLTSYAPSGTHRARALSPSAYCILFCIVERASEPTRFKSRVCSGQGGPENELAMRHIRPRTALFINSDPVPSISLCDINAYIIQTQTFIHVRYVHIGFNDAQGMSPPLNPTVQFRAAKANTPFHLNYSNRLKRE
jgi:hypothetical protein